MHALTRSCRLVWTVLLLVLPALFLLRFPSPLSLHLTYLDYHRHPASSCPYTCTGTIGSVFLVTSRKRMYAYFMFS